jgi:hypothetical protein
MPQERRRDGVLVSHGEDLCRGRYSQVEGGFARLRVVLEGDRLSLTPIENSQGRIAAGVTSRYVRVE